MKCGSNSLSIFSYHGLFAERRPRFATCGLCCMWTMLRIPRVVFRYNPKNCPCSRFETKPTWSSSVTRISSFLPSNHTNSKTTCFRYRVFCSGTSLSLCIIRNRFLTAGKETRNSCLRWIIGNGLQFHSITIRCAIQKNW